MTVLREFEVGLRFQRKDMLDPRSTFDLEETIRGASDERLVQLWEYLTDERLPGLAPPEGLPAPTREAAAAAAAELRSLRETIDESEYKSVAGGVLLVMILAPIDAAAEGLEQSPENWPLAEQTVQEATTKLNLAQRILAHAPGLSALADLAEKAAKIIAQAFS